MRVEHLDASDRATWLAMRAQDLTASDVAAICGLDPFKTPMRVFAEKTGLIPPEPENNAMKRGRHFEAAAHSWLCEDYPSWQVRRSSVYLRAPDLRMGATPDFAAVDPEREGLGIIQNKVVARRNFNEKWRGLAEGEDDFDASGPISAPIGYQLQTIMEAKLAGATWAAISALVVGEFGAELHLVPVEIHEGAWQRLTDEVAFFWRSVAEGRMPDIDPERDGSTIKALYPEPKQLNVLDLTGDNELPEILRERDEIKEAIKRSEARVDAIETIIKARIGEFEAITTADNRLIKWKNEPRAERITPASNPRVLRVGKPKAKGAK